MTPEEWRVSLDKSLEARREWVNLFEAYYDGEHPMVFSTSKWREAFGTMLRTYRDNWCLPTGELVMTQDGARPIHLIRPGEMVEGHDGNLHEVTQVLGRSVDEDIVAMRTFGSPTVRMTANHPVLATRLATMTSITAKYADDRHFRCLGTGANLAWAKNSVDREWIPAGDLEPGDIVWSGAPWTTTAGTFSPEFERLLGWYMAEGSVSDNGRIAFSLHASEGEYQTEIAQLLKSVCGVERVTFVPTSGDCIQVVTYSKEWARRFADYGGRGSHNKRLSPEVFRHGLLTELVQAAFDGDAGWSGGTISYTTASIDWAAQLQVILARYGVACRWQTLAPRGSSREAYRLAVSGEAARYLAGMLGWEMGQTAWDKAPAGCFVDGYVGYAVAKTDRERWAGDVWDLSVEDVHSFVLPGMIATHNCDLVVDASVERLSVVGFRFGEPGGDDDAWRIWQANNLDEGSGLVHTDAVTCGEAYVLVSPAPRGSDLPQLTPEHPSQVYVRTDPANSRRRLAAIKKWRDDDGFIRSNVYLPDGVVKFRSTKAVQGNGIVGGQVVSDTMQYERFGPDNGVEDNPFEVVPIVPFVNRRRTLRGGRSDIDTVIPRQDFINKLGADLLVASEFAAFRQRWGTGVEVPTDEFGNPIESYEAAVSRFWTFESPDIKVGEFQASDLGNYVQAIEMMIQHVAATTRTPPHYLLGQSGAFPSGESLKATETGLVAKVKSKQTSFGESWEEVLRLAFTARNDTRRGSLIDAETLWRDPESRSEAEHVDATLKLKDILPWEFLMERLGYSPQEIARARSTRTTDALEAMFRQPAATPPDPTTVI